ncbi:unnamed protein product [Prunus brigantina]
MVSPWPFAQWGLDLIGPMPEGKGRVKYAIVAVDYFTKWAEAEALATITAARIETFVWQNIVEAVNKIIKRTLKTKLDKAKGCWPELLPEELRNQSNMRNVAYKQRIAKYYDSRVKPRAFKVGDWVMRKVSLATKNPTEGTLGPTWEGPYEVTRISRPGAYQLRDSKGKTLPRPWNADHLKYYYK